MPSPPSPPTRFCRGHEPAVERDLVRVHAAVPDRVDGAALDRAAAGLLEAERVAGRRLLLHDEQRQAAVARGAVGIGAGQQHEHVRPTGERRPRLHAADRGSRRPQAVAATFTPATSEPKSGSVTITPTISSPVAICGSHRCFCSSVPPCTMARVRISGRVMSEPPTPSEPHDSSSVGDDHAEVVGLAAGREPAVLLGHRQAEATDLGEPGDHLLGDVGVRAVDVLGDRADLVLGEAVERLAHQLEVVVEVRRTGAVARELVGERLEELGRPVLRHEVARRSQSRRRRRPRSRRGAMRRAPTSAMASATNARASCDSNSPWPA